jgi:hypothetical protein
LQQISIEADLEMHIQPGRPEPDLAPPQASCGEPIGVRMLAGYRLTEDGLFFDDLFLAGPFEFIGEVNNTIWLAFPSASENKTLSVPRGLTHSGAAIPRLLQSNGLHCSTFARAQRLLREFMARVEIDPQLGRALSPELRFKTTRH